MMRRLVFVALLLTAGCGGPGHVQYDGGRCLEDGQPLTMQQVEAEQTRVARRISSRQPWFAVITIGVVLVAVASNAQRALLLFRARHREGKQPLAERIREALSRRSESPVLFATVVGTSLLLIAVGAGFYVYLDVDKRANERALGMLQFCHLALRTQREQLVLDEQRENLQAIQSTAGDIRTLVGKLPPDQQRKARLIVSQMNDALAKQGKIVGDYAARTDEAQKDLAAHTAAMEKGLASVQGDLAGLRSLPNNVQDIESATHRIDQATGSIDGRFDDLQAKIAAVDAKVDALLAQQRAACSEPSEPVAARAPRPAASEELAARPAAATPAAPPPAAAPAAKSSPAPAASGAAAAAAHKP